MAAVRPLFLLLFFLFFFFPSVSLSASEAQALIQLKNSFTQPDNNNNNNDNPLSSWVPNSSPCKSKWAGVMCFDGIITGLHLTGMGLSGKIDVLALLEIRGLRTISFMNNNFTGPMPEFNKIGALKSLLLSGNAFSGEIPSDFFSHLNSLKKVWLNENRFTGSVPDSLAKLTHLIELHLENNQFTGPIPDFKKPINSLDLSNNKLEGEIPASLSTYNASAFAGNDGLCGKPLDKACKPSFPFQAVPDPAAEAAAEAEAQSSTNASQIVVGVVIGMLVLFIFVVFLKSRRSRDDDFSQLEKDYVEEVVEVHVPAATARSRTMELSRGKGGDSGSKKGSHHGKNAMTDLIMVNDERGTFGLPDLMKAAAEVLGNGGLGSAYKATMSNGLAVVVKRMREMNKLARDGFDAEMRRLGRLRHVNILTPLAYHYRREEKLLVSEYKPKGSLLYVLHGDRGIYHAELKWPVRLKIIQGVARGLGFLYTEFESCTLPHGNLKSSNVILDDNYEALLSDYAFDHLMQASSAQQAMFAYRTPDFTEHQQVSAKTDVYCLGLIVLEVLTGKFPCQYLSAGKGGIDVIEWVRAAIQESRERELLDPEIVTPSASDTSVAQMLKLLEIGSCCTEADPQRRLDIMEAIRRIGEIQV